MFTTSSRSQESCCQGTVRFLGQQGQPRGLEQVTQKEQNKRETFQVTQRMLRLNPPPLPQAPPPKRPGSGFWLAEGRTEKSLGCLPSSATSYLHGGGWTGGWAGGTMGSPSKARVLAQVPVPNQLSSPKCRPPGSSSVVQQPHPPAMEADTLLRPTSPGTLAVT